MLKNQKNSLRQGTVDSKTLHVGIELELVIDGNSGEREHDDEGCEEAYRESIANESACEILREHFGLNQSDARAVENYFNHEEWINDRIENYECEHDECAYWSEEGDEDSTRENLEQTLSGITGNTSIKVVADSSIESGSDVDAEVCWNYFASRDTLADNSKILKHLSSIDAKFNTSCGLHINLNNYLNVSKYIVIETECLGFLFDFVAKSRRKSSFCNRYGMANEKYSMIFNQGDRLEFRFFSPTLEPEKLNHYVTLANTVYKRLAGKDSKLPKKSETYFLNKMVTVNGLSAERAKIAIDSVNQIMIASGYVVNDDNTDSEIENERAA